LEGQPGWTVVAEAADGKETVEKVLEMNPDVALLDIQMPTLNGLEAAREIVKSGSKAKILILTMHDSDSLIREMLDLGAKGYVLKSDAARDLVAACAAVHHNKTFFTAKVAEMILDGYLRKRKNPDESESSGTRLTLKQREILKLLTQGKSSKEMAVALGISAKTAEKHRANIMQRLKCHSISELVRYAVRNGIVEP
jgi:DNA-binding NarL/FixJ family response regulator